MSRLWALLLLASQMTSLTTIQLVSFHGTCKHIMLWSLVWPLSSCGWLTLPQKLPAHYLQLSSTIQQQYQPSNICSCRLLNGLPSDIPVVINLSLGRHCSCHSLRHNALSLYFNNCASFADYKSITKTHQVLWPVVSQTVCPLLLSPHVTAPGQWPCGASLALVSEPQLQQQRYGKVSAKHYIFCPIPLS